MTTAKETTTKRRNLKKVPKTIKVDDKNKANLKSLSDALMNLAKRYQEIEGQRNLLIATLVNASGKEGTFNTDENFDLVEVFKDKS